MLLPLLAQVGPYAPTNIQISDPSDFVDIYQKLVGQWTGAVGPYANEVFGALALLEMGAFGWDLLKNHSGDLRATMMATTGKLLTIGIFLDLLIHGQAWMDDIMSMFVTVGKAASGVKSLSPSAVLFQGFIIFGTLLARGLTTGILSNVPAGLALMVSAFLVMISFLVITYQFVVTLIQSYVALGAGYFFLAFGSSRYTTTYVERYFAFCFSAGAKLMVLYMLTGAASLITNNWAIQAAKVSPVQSGVSAAWLIAAGAMLYAGIVWNLSSLVGNFFGAGPNLGHGDAIALTAPMIGAAISAAMIASGIGAGAGAAAGGAGIASGSGGASGAAAGAGRASGATPPQPSAPSSGGGGVSIGRAAGQMAQTMASAARQMPHGGGQSSPPTFNGFHH